MPAAAVILRGLALIVVNGRKACVDDKLFKKKKKLEDFSSTFFYINY